MEMHLPAPPPDPRPAWLQWLTSKPVRTKALAILGAAAPLLCLYLPGAIPQQICRAIAPLLFM